jgi:hypothetical protein
LRRRLDELEHEPDSRDPREALERALCPEAFVAVASSEFSSLLEGELMSVADKTYSGQCFCGAVTIEVSGEPVGAGYCHCANCRSWSAGPVNAFTLWKPNDVKVTSGEDQLGEFHNTEQSYRQWCRICGGHLLTRHPTWGLVDVYAATIPSFPFAPGVHVNYASTVLPMKDGLPKLKDFPEELGGSGEAMAE